MRGRTVILVSHHVQLCAPGAEYVVALENGRVQFQGDRDSFDESGVKDSLIQSEQVDDKDKKDEEPAPVIEEVATAVHSLSPSDEGTAEGRSETSSTVATSTTSDVKAVQKKPPRKLVEEETRAVGRISREVWETYIWACGRWWYWVVFLAIMILGAMSPVAENKWLEYVDAFQLRLWH